MNKLICIVCPRGCHLDVDENLNVKGNFCKRGETYGKNEVTNPTRVITTTVKVISEDFTRLPVKTDRPVPKKMVFEIMDEINRLNVKTPINVNDVLIENVLNTGANVVCTRSVMK